MDKQHTRRSVMRTLALVGCALPIVTSGAYRARRRPISRIGFLIGTGYEPLIAAFKDELRKHDYIEGENIEIETRQSQSGIDMRAQVAQLAQMDLTLIVAGALPFALEVRKANRAMPMVVATCPGMISNGFAHSLAHPGGNVTGIDELPPGVTAKRLTLLKMAAPRVSRIALLSTTPGRGGHETQLADAERAAVTLGVSVKPYRASSLGELESALAAIEADGMDGLENFQGGLSLSNRQLIVDFAAKHRLPAIYQATLFPEAGGLMAWAPDLLNQYRMAARYVAQILRGAYPGDLAIQYPPRYYLTINLRAARNLALSIPQTLLQKADKILS